MTRTPAGDFDYDQARIDYAARRRPDPRIAARIHAALGGARTVINVGAGAGSYEPEDRHVVAVEPAASMRAQRPRGLAPAVRASAASLPFDDGAFDAAMAILTVHHWPDQPAGLAELRRVTRGPIAVVTFDAEAAGRYWLDEYIPEIAISDAKRLPTITALTGMLGGAGRVRVEELAIPIDCADGFTEAFYARPEQLLDPKVRAAQSVWKFVPEEAVARFERTLKHDLASGAWDRRHGRSRTMPEFYGALRLVVSQP